MTKEEFKTFVKENWKPIVGYTIGGLATIGLGVVAFKGIKKLPVGEGAVLQSISDWQAKEQERIASVGWNGVGELTSLWDEGGCTNAIVENLKYEDMGKLGEELLKIDGIAKDSGVDLVIGMAKEIEP